MKGFRYLRTRYRIPKRNCSNNEIEPTGAIALVVKGAISDFSQAVEEDGLRK